MSFMYAENLSDDNINVVYDEADCKGALKERGVIVGKTIGTYNKIKFTKAGAITAQGHLSLALIGVWPKGGITPYYGEIEVPTELKSQSKLIEIKPDLKNVYKAKTKDADVIKNKKRREEMIKIVKSRDQATIIDKELSEEFANYICKQWGKYELSKKEKTIINEIETSKGIKIVIK